MDNTLLQLGVLFHAAPEMQEPHAQQDVPRLQEQHREDRQEHADIASVLHAGRQMRAPLSAARTCVLADSASLEGLHCRGARCQALSRGGDELPASYTAFARGSRRPLAASKRVIEMAPVIAASASGSACSRKCLECVA